MAGALADRVFAAGVVGAGGGGFPTHRKLACQVECVVANAAECEPLLCNDQEVISREWPGVVRGLRLVAQATGARKLLVAIKGKSLALLPKELPADVEVVKLPDCYPAGDEHEVVPIATGRLVPEGGLPVQVGVLVQNVETLRNVAAAWDGTPVTQRTLTVGGCVAEPRVVRVPIGTPVRDLLPVCGGATCEDPVFFLGGVMMGCLTEDSSTPIAKTTAAVIVLPRQHVYVQQRSQRLEHQLRNARSACTQCVLCTESCNRYLLGHGLEPHRVMRAAALGSHTDTKVARMALLCSECGACEYACPMGLSPRMVNRAVKEHLRSLGTMAPRQRTVQPRVPVGTGRIPTHRLMARFDLTPYYRPARYCETMIVPRQVHIPLKQHAGAPARPVVAIGQKVREGELVGQVLRDELGACVHASVSGRVVQVDSHVVTIATE
ncbi:MAG: 4Fe-4S dicluster domain-containing protein [candidate division KSB1 bacterium]|nr:4Fe-4S dicluster domain-containing protein [candidate division KSB1 bacterium]